MLLIWFKITKLKCGIQGFRVSVVGKLGHTGIRALTTRGCAPPTQALMQIIAPESTVANFELGAKMYKGLKIQ